MSTPSRSTRTLARASALGVLLAVAVGAGWWLDLAALRAALDGLGGFGPVLFVVLFALVTPAFVPDTPLAALAGALYGAVGGTLLLCVGEVLAASLTYVLARWLLRRPLQRLSAGHPRLRAIENVVAGGGLAPLILLRLVPVNPASVNTLLAATDLGFRPYLVSCVGLVPAYFATAYAGSLARRVGDGTGASRGLATLDLVGLGLTVLGLAVGVWAAERALRRRAAGWREDSGR